MSLKTAAQLSPASRDRVMRHVPALLGADRTDLLRSLFTLLRSRHSTKQLRQRVREHITIKTARWLANRAVFSTENLLAAATAMQMPDMVIDPLVVDSGLDTP